jgi:AcrR family transcriptional regulator
MPYTAEHKRATRARIVECARSLFNRKGFSGVSVDELMHSAGLTRGGFYNHFASKEELFAEAIEAYAICGPSGHWGSDLDMSLNGAALSEQVIKSYLSKAHLDDVAGQCPMVALPSDIARSGPEAKRAYEAALENLVTIFSEISSRAGTGKSRQHALSLLALCTGGMLMARTVGDETLAEEIRKATRQTALSLHKAT